MDRFLRGVFSLIADGFNGQNNNKMTYNPSEPKEVFIAQMNWEGVPSGRVYLAIYKKGGHYADVIRSPEEGEFVKKLNRKRLGGARLIKAPTEILGDFVPTISEIQDDEFERLSKLYDTTRNLDSLISSSSL